MAKNSLDSRAQTPILGTCNDATIICNVQWTGKKTVKILKMV